mmetsp:Transcript_12496/g.31741  ORF Transcript_12496/g.31741 Transcript_12496/m.31741 type:complete len:309 (+) Transcript_12496:398-1324(+)
MGVHAGAGGADPLRSGLAHGFGCRLWRRGHARHPGEGRVLLPAAHQAVECRWQTLHELPVRTSEDARLQLQPDGGHGHGAATEGVALLRCIRLREGTHACKEYDGAREDLHTAGRPHGEGWRGAIHGTGGHVQTVFDRRGGRRGGARAGVQLHPGDGHRQPDGHVLQHRPQRRFVHVPWLPHPAGEGAQAALPRQDPQGEQGGDEEAQAQRRGPAEEETHGVPRRRSARRHHEGQGRVLDLEERVGGARHGHPQEMRSTRTLIPPESHHLATGTGSTYGLTGIELSAASETCDKPNQSNTKHAQYTNV